MQITGYDGFTFSDLTMAGELPVEQGAGWQINQTIVPRGAAFAAMGASQPSVYTVDVEFVYTGARTDYWQLFAELAGALNPLDQGARRKLYATRPDGTAVWRYAKVTMPAWWTDEDNNSVTVRFVSSDPRWHAVTPTTIAPFADFGSGGAPWLIGKNTPGFAVPNAGLTPVHPVIEVPAGGIAIGTGWRYRRKQVITNDLPRTVQNMVLLFELGDTAALVTGGKALASGDDLRVIAPNGQEVPRDLVAWNTLGTRVYVYIANIAPGESQTYDILYGNPAAGSPLTLAYPYKPAFLTTWVYGVSAGTSAADNTYINAPIYGGSDRGDWTALAAPAGGGRDNKYKDGALIFLSGANAGVGRKIAGHVYQDFSITNRITFTSAFPNAIDSADDWLIVSSRNGVWMYDTQSDVNRGSDYARGRWYSNSGESPPDTISYDVPGAWRPYLYKDGRDKHGQPQYSRITHGGDLDTYTVLDAQRSWENGARVQEEGVADGVSLSLPFGIIGYDFTSEFTNPTGHSTAFVGSRKSGGNDWLELASTAAVNATATDWSPAISVSGALQLYHGLIPTLGDEVDQTWRKDSGSSSAVGTTTTLVDAKKNWQTDQWKGAKLTFTAGGRSGLVVSVTGNTATTLTFSPALGGNTKQDQAYEVTNPPVLARLRDKDRCTVTWDETGFVIGSMGAEEIVTDISARLWFGGGSASNSVLSGQRREAVELGKATDVFLPVKDAYEFVNVDSALRSAELRDYATRTIQRRYPDPRVRFRYTDDLGVEMQSQNGMQVPVGVNRLANPGAETGVGGWADSAGGGAIGYSFGQDATVYALAQHGSKSFKFTIASSTAGAYVQMVADDRIPIRPGELAQLAGWVRTTHADLRPRLGIVFYDAGGAAIATDLQASVAQSVNQWLGEAHAAIAPALAASYGPVARVTVAAGTPAGAVFFDDFDIGSPVLFVQSDRNLGAELRVLFTEAYLL